MVSITSNAKFRQRVVRYSYKYGATKASDRFRISRNAVYEWRAKYDGHWKSLRDRSHRPKSHPAQHTEEEIKLVKNHWLKNKDDKILLWDTLRKKGYKRQYNSMLRVIRRLGMAAEENKRKSYKPKPYKRAEYPGQKVQIDVKYVPAYCVAVGVKYYQFTAVDECTRYTFREMYEEHSTDSAFDFLKKLILNFPFPISEIQTDNGTEFTKALLVNDPNDKSLFEEALEAWGIKYHRIRIATPRHNGKVERQHRIDEQRFYRKTKIRNLKEGKDLISKYNKKSNNIPKICLSFHSPAEIIERYLGVM